MDPNKVSSLPLIYSAIFPSLIYPGSPYVIALFVEAPPFETSPGQRLSSSSGQLQFSAQISDGPRLLETREISITGGNSGQLTLNISNHVDAALYQLTIRVRGDDPNLPEETSTIPIFWKKESSLTSASVLLAHTDKGVYKPGDTVRFRVLLLDPDLRPHKTPKFGEESFVRIQVSDSMKNVVKIWDRAPVNGHGLYQGQLDLSSEPLLGTWSLQVSTTSPQEPVTKRLSFSVEKYVLPKFKVTFDLPPFLIFDSTKALVTVKAKYTYGGGVAGSVTITPKLRKNENIRAFVRRGTQRRLKATITPSVAVTLPINQTGTVSTELDIAQLFGDRALQETFIDFDLEFTDQLTGNLTKMTSSVFLHEFPYKIKFSELYPYQPGLPYSVSVQVTRHDDTPIEDPAPDALEIRHGFSYDIEGSRLTSPIPPNGTVTFRFETPSNDLIAVGDLHVRYKDCTTRHSIYDRSCCDVPFRIEIDDLDLDPRTSDQKRSPNSPLKIHLSCTRRFDSVNYIFSGADNRISGSGRFQFPNPAKIQGFSVFIPPGAKGPTIFLAFAQIDLTPETARIFVGRCIELDVGSKSGHLLTLKLSDEVREPGQEVTLQIQSSPDSLVALRGIDQSVLLMGSDPDLTMETVGQEVRSGRNQNRNRNKFGVFFEQRTLLEICQATDLNLLTNKLEKVPGKKPIGIHRPSLQSARDPESYDWENEFYTVSRGGESNSRCCSAVSPSRFDDRMDQPAVLVRSEFPETWLWEELLVNENGELTRSFKVPDTLTSYIITGYSIHKERGLTFLPQPTTLTVFRSFFLSLNLPYLVVKGEVLALQVLVHNYSSSHTDDLGASTDDDLVDITLYNEEGKFQLCDPGKQVTQKVRCPRNAVMPVIFQIQPTEFGSILVAVEGRREISENFHSRDDADKLEQQLRVIPPGEKQIRSVTSLITLQGQPGKISEESLIFATDFPKSRVPGADSVKLSVTSNLLGSTMENLDSLIAMPTGCGEQNMLNFVADVVVLDYLKATGDLQRPLQVKAIGFLEKGYQNELTFRHSNGSFSCFGRGQGSTWLTIFVVRSFLRAQSHIHIDPAIIDQGLDYIAGCQDSENSGRIMEKGQVLRYGLEGGSKGDGTALTAFALLAFLEFQEISHQDKYAANIEKGLKYILGKTESTKKDANSHRHSLRKKSLPSVSYLFLKMKLAQKSYALNFDLDLDPQGLYAFILTTYALHVAGHEEKDGHFEILQKLAVSQDGGKLVHWSVEKDKVTAAAVEVTGYALLVYLHHGDLTQCLPIVRWLLKQQSPRGGFLSTQDTVVGLTALAKFTELTQNPDIDIQMTAKIGTATDQKISVTTENALMLQEFILPPSTRSIALTATGRGSVLAQLSWCFYVEEPNKRPAFDLVAKVREEGAALMWLLIGASFNAGEVSNMVIVQANLPSGYKVFDADDLEHALKRVPKYQRHDLKNGETTVDIYLESMTQGVPVSIEIRAFQSFRVEKKAKSLVTVYDYYDPSQKATSFFEFKT